ncbi:ribonuclease III [Chloroflexota bacterium]
MSHLKDLEEALKISFRNVELLEQALTHASFYNEKPESAYPSNERLEFLGDAVLGLIITETLYLKFPERSEGSLTKLRSALVCQDTLYRLAVNLNLGEHLRLGRGELKSKGATRPSNLTGALESIIGAIYLDQGIEAARKFVFRLMYSEIEYQYPRLPEDYKSQLQELLHTHKRQIPVYRIVEIYGPDHDKRFTSEVLEGETILARGTAKSKKGAEIEAARAALEAIEPNTKDHISTQTDSNDST